MPHRIPLIGIVLRFAFATAATVAYVLLTFEFGWKELSRERALLEMPPLTISEFLFLKEARSFHAANLNTGGIIFAIALVSSFNIRDAATVKMFLILNTLTLGFAALTSLAITAFYLPGIADHH